MGILQNLLSGKNVETVAKVLEEGVEKIVQYGQKTLTVMKAKVTDVAVLNGGGLYDHEAAAKMFNQSAILGHLRRSAKKVHVLDKSTGQTSELNIINFYVTDGSYLPRHTLRRLSLATPNGTTTKHKTFSSLADSYNMLNSGHTPHPMDYQITFS